MKRKRFIRLLMSRGIQRNAAWKLAKMTNKRGISYAEGFPTALMSAMVICFGYKATEVANAFKKLGAEAAEAAFSFEEALTAVGKVDPYRGTPEDGNDEAYERWRKAQGIEKGEAADEQTLRSVFDAMDDEDK